MKRFTQVEVELALAATERGAFTPHDQIVLGGEVEALRAQFRVALFCPEHAVLMHVAPGGTARECWHCTEGKRLRDEADGLRAALRGASDCPESRPVDGGAWRCWYRTAKQRQVTALQLENGRLRELMARWALGRRGIGGGDPPP